MNIEAFLWNYQANESIGFDFETVRKILSTDDTDWLEEHGCLRVHFPNPDHVVDIYFGKDIAENRHINGIMVSRLINHPDYLQRIFRVMELGDVMLFYSDETTPVFIEGSDSGQYPNDLLEELGKPRYVQAPTQLLHQER